jgi:hypothetical protein
MNTQNDASTKVGTAVTVDSGARISVSRRTEASPPDVFAIIADPQRHTEFDGSGMLRGSESDQPITGIGDVLIMTMYSKKLVTTGCSTTSLGMSATVALDESQRQATPRLPKTASAPLEFPLGTDGSSS